MNDQEFNIYPYAYPEIPAEIHNALLAAKINLTQRMLCNYILRLTYEGDRTAAPIGFNEFSYLKTLSVPWIKKQLKLLADRKIVLCLEERPGNIGIYIINPKISEWKTKRPYNKKAAVM